jgi:hypothetical protein
MQEEETLNALMIADTDLFETGIDLNIAESFVLLLTR